MFLGHFAVALAARRAAPEVSLGVLFAASQWADLVWPVLLLAGIEQAQVDPHGTIPLLFTHYPYSHSLAALLLWAAIWFAGGLAVYRKVRAAAVLGLLVLSHWALDALVHVPDLPLTVGGAERIGLGLWLMPKVALAVEFASLAAGAWVYARGTKPQWPLVSLLIFLAVIQLANTLGPPPPGITPVAVSGIAMWLLVAWGAWADSREARTRREKTANLSPA